MNIQKIKKKFQIKKGQIPLTKFVDNLNNLSVELIDWPDEQRLKRVFANMTQSSWYEDFVRDADKEDVDEIIHDMLQGKSLSQASEHPQFCFRVSGIDLHITHALVRNRIGISYLQRSLAVSDLRHEDIVVPRAYTKTPELLNKYIKLAIQGKEIYSEMLDTGDISNTDARISLLKSVPSWIYITCSLPTLLAIYAKRTDTQEEHPILNLMCEQLKNKILNKFQFMESYFKSSCDTGNCLHKKKGYAANCIFKRDNKHVIENYQDEWTFHDKTKHELMINAKPFKERYFYGTMELNKEEYLEIKNQLENETIN